MDENKLRSLLATDRRDIVSLVRRGVIATLALAIGLSTASSASATSLQDIQGGNVYALTSSNELLRFRERTPFILRMKRQISGTDGALIGIDFRPADQKLYGVSKSGVIYTIDPSSAVATRVAQMNVAIEGSAFGFDFNPNADRLRIVSDTDQNLRVNIATGETTQDGRLAYADNDPNRGQNPRVGGAGYTNPDTVPNTPTTLLDIDTTTDSLVRQDPPNDGKLNTVGRLGVNSGEIVGFDIRADGSALAALAPGRSPTRLYSVDLGTGATRLYGRIGLREEVRGIAAPLGGVADDD